MTTGRNCNNMTDMSSQEMMGNLSEETLPTRSSHDIMNHDFGMDIGESTGFKEQY